MSQQSTTIPWSKIVIPLSVTPTKHTRLLKVVCPFCGKKHGHGWPYDNVDPHPGLRSADCTPGGSYYIYVLTA